MYSWEGGGKNRSQMFLTVKERERGTQWGQLQAHEATPCGIVYVCGNFSCVDTLEPGEVPCVERCSQQYFLNTEVSLLQGVF